QAREMGLPPCPPPVPPGPCTARPHPQGPPPQGPPRPGTPRMAQPPRPPLPYQPQRLRQAPPRPEPPRPQPRRGQPRRIEPKRPERPARPEVLREIVRRALADPAERLIARLASPAMREMLHAEAGQIERIKHFIDEHQRQVQQLRERVGAALRSKSVSPERREEIGRMLRGAHERLAKLAEQLKHQVLETLSPPQRERLMRPAGRDEGRNGPPARQRVEHRQGPPAAPRHEEPSQRIERDRRGRGREEHPDRDRDRD
ncbi:MAG: hypothetical protein J7M21_06375, partial [Planctomycetes bacterium]|nr:hypothetical protein [Planctomycetota bacterium]